MYTRRYLSPSPTGSIPRILDEAETSHRTERKLIVQKLMTCDKDPNDEHNNESGAGLLW